MLSKGSDRMPKTLTPELMKEILDKSDNIVFFGGAGVSTESGIPDFRSTDGLYRACYPFPPETILSHSFFLSRPDEFFRFYKDKMIYQKAKPNACHLILAQWERMGKLKGVITQNIDNLHHLAGSQNVLELHGSIYRNHCMKCGKSYGIAQISEQPGIPRCACGGIIKPDVILYEEALDEDCMEKARNLIRKADVLIIGGTSLTVYPAAGLVHFYRGSKLVLINKDKGLFDSNVDFVHYGSIAEFFSKIEGL
jgi:NAD-dependent deacetylase